MAWDQSDLDKIDAAISSGIRRVTFADGRSTEYQNVAEMLKARDVVSAEIAGPGDVGRRRQRRVIIGRVARA